MAFLVLGNLCEFTATLSGASNFIVGAATLGKFTPEQSNVTDAKVYTYYAQSPDGTQWEQGSGTYTISTHTLARTIIVANSNDDLKPVSFSFPPIVDVYPSAIPLLEPTPFPITFDVVIIQKFTAGGTYTPSTGMFYCIIECQAGGGAGGGAQLNAAGNQNGGGGGGGGGYSRLTASAATIGVSKVVTIGAGGTVGGAGNFVGGNGGDTSVGTLCIAKGGTGGNGAAPATAGAAGSGGIAGTGDIALPGFPGVDGFQATIVTFLIGKFSGGNSRFGQGGESYPATIGTTGTGFGSGGGGGMDFNGTNNFTGSAGRPGLVIITEFCKQ